MEIRMVSAEKKRSQEWPNNYKPFNVFKPCLFSTDWVRCVFLSVSYLESNEGSLKIDQALQEMGAIPNKFF